jgi:hypothetical protein
MNAVIHKHQIPKKLEIIRIWNLSINAVKLRRSYFDKLSMTNYTRSVSLSLPKGDA